MSRNQTSTLAVLSGVSDLAAAVAAIQTLGIQLRDTLVERDDDIRAALLALVAEEHVLFLGPPGTAKSLLAKLISGAMDATYFEVLLSKFSTPEEINGPLDMVALQDSRFERNTAGYLPEADVAFFDEIFKSNSALLNSMLTALNERKFDNGGKRHDIPLKMAIGASNELPEDESLNALYDRFVMRRWVTYIKDKKELGKLLLNTARSGGIKPTVITAKLTGPMLNTLRAARNQVTIDDVLDPLLKLRDGIAAEGIVASDRRWVKIVKFVQASAVLDGRAEATVDDLDPLADCLWDKPEDRPDIDLVIAGLVSPDQALAVKTRDAAAAEFTKLNLSNIEMEDITGLGLINEQLTQMVVSMNRLQQTDKISKLTKEVSSMQLTLANAVAKAIGI